MRKRTFSMENYTRWMAGRDKKPRAWYESENNLIRKHVVPFPLHRPIVPLNVAFHDIGIKRPTFREEARQRDIDGVETERPTCIAYCSNRRTKGPMINNSCYTGTRTRAFSTFQDNFCCSFRHSWQQGVELVASVYLFRISHVTTWVFAF